MSALYDDLLNPDWEGPSLPGWEPWEPDEDVDVREGGCAYCGAPDVRDVPDPFGGKPCCESCFLRIIGDEDDDPLPWVCRHEAGARLVCWMTTLGGGNPTVAPAKNGRSSGS